MSVNCNICSFLLGFNTVSNLSHIKTHCYIAITSVCVGLINNWIIFLQQAKFSGIITGFKKFKLNIWQTSTELNGILNIVEPQIMDKAFNQRKYLLHIILLIYLISSMIVHGWRGGGI